jgi:hypothetical protein
MLLMLFLVGQMKTNKYFSGTINRQQITKEVNMQEHAIIKDHDVLIERLKNIDYNNISKQTVVTMLEIGDQLLLNLAETRKIGLAAIAELAQQTSDTLETIAQNGRIEEETRKRLQELRGFLLSESI